jgi:hypothetical protein
MAELCPASATDENSYHLRGRKDKKLLQERKPFALTVSALVRVFEY